jgi:L-2,4-diaminobutyrate decarboxylase
MFRRVGWTPDQYQAWSDHALAEGSAFVVPSLWNGETIFRFCFINPLTTLADVQAILDSMAA